MAGRPPLPYRVRAVSVLLAVGAVLLVTGAVAGAAEAGGPWARASVLLLAAAAALASAAGSGLRRTREALAATAVALALAGAGDAGSLFAGSPVPPAVLALLLAGVARARPRPVAWPLGAWAAAQLAAVRALPGLEPGPARDWLLLAVALGGVGVVLGGRRLVARVVLGTTVPWWVAAVAGATATAWSGAGPAAWGSVGLAVVAAAALLLARLEPDVDPLLGPPGGAPVLAGLVVGLAGAGALSAGAGAPLAAGYTGVLLVCLAAATLRGWPRGLLFPAAVAAGATLIVLAVVRLVASSSWRELVLLLVLSAAPSALVARWRRDERPAAVPTTVACLLAAVLLAVPADLLTPGQAAAAATALYAAALAGSTRMAPDTRRPTATVAAGCAAAALLLLAGARTPGPLAAHLAVQGSLAWAWGLWAGHHAEAAGAARRAGAAELVAACWLAFGTAGVDVPEAYTVPAALGLLLAAGPRLGAGPSWPAWGPGLLVAAVPSTVLVVLQPEAQRPLAVLALATAAMLGGARHRVRTLLVTGAATTVALAVGLAVVALPLPLAAALVIGTGLLTLGAYRELRPVGNVVATLARMR